MSKMSRREIYRQSKRLLVNMLLARWDGSRRSLERSVWRFLRGRQRAYLVRLLQRRAAAISAAGLILLAGSASAGPLVQLSDVDSGIGGFAASGDGSFGFAVSGGTDINGDGLADVLIGAPYAYANDSNPGKAYVIFGKADTSGVAASTIEAGTGGFAIIGNTGQRQIGGSVSSAGPINDGTVPDIVIGANQQFGGSDARTYFVHGKSTTTPVDVTTIEAGTGGFVVTGLESEQYGSSHVFAFGDINGDGRDDAVIGTPTANYYTGRVYVAFGKNNTTAVTAASIAAGSGGFVINGVLTNDRAGASVSIVGDLNGDGRDEIVLGAPGSEGGGVNNDAGAVYVVYGKTGGTPVSLATVQSGGGGGFVIRNGNSFDYAGNAVAGCGDVNGDGKNDILIGIPNAYYADSNSYGLSYVVFGKGGTAAVELSTVAEGTGGFVIRGRSSGTRSGHAVASAGDINGDGLADVLIGTGIYGYQPGEAYVVFGKTNTDPVSLQDVRDGIGGIGVVGAANGDGAGRAVAGAGDVNGDGANDFIVGAPLDNKAFVVFGPQPAPVSVGLTSSAPGNPPISSGVVFVERTDAPVGFRAPLSGLVGGSAIYESRFADIGAFNVTAIASGFQASAPVLVSNDGATPGIQLDPDNNLTQPNILTVVIRVLNQQGLATGQRVLTKTAQLRVDAVPLDITPVYGLGSMVFIGAPSGEVEIFIPDTASFDYIPKVITLGTGVQQTVIVDAKQLDAALRADLPGIVVGSVVNGNVDPIDVYAEPLVVHTLNANGFTTSTNGTVDGAFVLPDVINGTGTIQAFSPDGTIAGSIKPVTVVSGQIYGDQQGEDTLLSVSPPSGDSDFDGLPDDFEAEFLDSVPTNLRGPDDDPDLDGLTNFDELVAATFPATFDSDNDGVADGVELVLGSNPNSSGSKPALQSEVFVDFGFVEPLKAGLLLHPYATLQSAISQVTSGGTIRIKGDVPVTTGDGPSEITKPMTIRSVNGEVRIE